MDTLIVFSHLRWNFVFQRPQQLMTRFARTYRVFFIEEPVYRAGSPAMEISEPSPNVHVCVPHTPFDSTGFHDQQIPALQTLIDELMSTFDVISPVAWLYTPMALPLVHGLRARSIVYDCMDELAAFKNAPRQLLQREHALLKAADFVFTGGPSLFQAKRSRHKAVYCFPSSVDEAHFSAARNDELECVAQAAVPRPRLGFFGVIDERLDPVLIDRIASTHPEWNVVLVGPIVKISPASLPHRSNIYYLGQKEYAELPALLAGWDVCLLPFALNEATRFISPTKTLEYMAALKPIVSTPVEDVATPYGDVVAIGQAERFIELCELALYEPKDVRHRRETRMRAHLEKTSWERTVEAMSQLLAQSGVPLDAARPNVQMHQQGMASTRSTKHQTVILGAGPTGLSAAYHLDKDCLLIDQNATVGGWCRSIQQNGFTFDYAGHIMFSNDPYVKELYQILLGENVSWQDREAWIYSKGVYTRYPFQGALYGLPPEVVAECIVGAVEARLGPLNGSKGQSPALPSSSPNACKDDSLTDCCADGSLPVGASHVGSSGRTATPPRNFEEFIYQVWGAGIAKHFAIPYNRKLWAVPLSTMETSWLGGRVPLPDLGEMIEGALQPHAKPVGPNARFGYPQRGGFQALMNGFLPHLEGEVRLNARVIEISPSTHSVALADGSVHHYDQLISTIPLPALVRMAKNETPPAVKAAAARLRHVSVRCVNLGIGRTDVTEKHWIYYPEASVFHRIFVQGNASPLCNAPGGFGITCEITYSPDKPLPCDGNELIDLCIADAIAVGLIRSDDEIVARNMVDMPYAYVIYDHGRAENVALIRDWAGAHDIVLAGRYSEWEYYNSDHAFLAGRDAATKVSGAARRMPGPAGDAAQAFVKA